jgi:microcompartment protein CcmK/EutM
MGCTHSREIVETAVEKMNHIDADWLREFDDGMLGYFAIDHADAGMDERAVVVRGSSA